MFHQTEQALLQELPDSVYHFSCRDIDNGARSFEIEPVDEDRQTTKKRLGLWSEQVVAPGDRIPHRLLATGEITRPIAQETQAVREEFQKGDGGQPRRPSGCQFDG